MVFILEGKKSILHQGKEELNDLDDEGPRYGGASDLRHTAYCNSRRIGHPNSETVCFCDCDDAGPRY